LKSTALDTKSNRDQLQSRAKSLISGLGSVKQRNERVKEEKERDEKVKGEGMVRKALMEYPNYSVKPENIEVKEYERFIPESRG
jgi:hypothetical protein